MYFPTILMLIFEISAIAGIGGASHHFQILTKYAEVEKRAVSYAKSKETLLGKALSWGSNRRTHICNTSSLRVRIEFCKRALRIHHYGFEFDLDNYAYWPCERQEFLTKSSALYELDMFICPCITFTDMETNEKVNLPYIYTASRGKSHDTAFVFVQRENGVFKHPLQYIKNIRFDALKTESESETINYWESLILPAYLASVKTKFKKAHGDGTYNKFRTRFHSINVCGLRRRHKIFICQLHMERMFRGKYSNMQLEGYDEKCRKHRIEVNNKKDFSNKELLVLLCPPMVSNWLEVKLALEGHYYVSTRACPYTTVLLHRENRKGEKLRFEDSSLLSIKDISKIMRDIDRERFRPYPENQRTKRAAQKSAAEIINENNSLPLTPFEWQWQTSPAGSVNEVQTMTRSSDLNDSKLLGAVWLAEDLIISFSKIKTTTRIYSRFMDTHQSTGLCELSESQHQRICEQVGFAIRTRNRVIPVETGGDDVSSCHRRPVLLRVREAEELASDIFAMRQCRYPKDAFASSFFVGKAHLSNTAIIYRSLLADEKFQFDPHTVCLHRVIININSNLLPLTSPFQQPSTNSGIPMGKLLDSELLIKLNPETYSIKSDKIAN